MRDYARLAIICSATLLSFSACSAPGSLPQPSTGSAFAARSTDLSIRRSTPVVIAMGAPSPSASNSPGDELQSAPIVAHVKTAAPVIAPISISAPTTVPVAVPGIRTHTQSAMYGQDSSATINGTFGMNDWAAAAQYVDMLFYPGSLSYNKAVRAGGIKTVIYVDPNHCSGSFAVGPNRFAGPNCATLSNDAFYYQPAFPDRSLTMSYNNVITQKFGNPQSTTLQDATLAWVQNVMATQGQFDYVEIDDGGTPAEYNPFGETMCWGVGSFANSKYSCTGSAGGAAGNPYGQYSKSAWQAGEAAMAAKMPLPVLFNGLESNDTVETIASIAPVATTASNVWGAMCETCFWSTKSNLSNTYLHASPILDRELNGVISVIGAGRTVMFSNNDVDDVGRREMAMADIMLAYDPDKVWMNESFCGQVSHIHACAEQNLTFYLPVGGYPTSVSQLRTAGGAYVREFGACYYRGQLIGPCASVVNPNRTTTIPAPVLGHLYTHTLTISGTGPCNCYGDSGGISTTGPQVPATLPAGSGYVLFL